MKHRNSERFHPWSNETFNFLSIFDLQGLLKEGGHYSCGVEAYQVSDFGNINFNVLKKEEEFARYRLCKQLNVPYYVIVTSEKNESHRIFNVSEKNAQLKIHFEYELPRDKFISWWRKRQSFTQTKAMYNASRRISSSIIDKDLFSNSLAWGVNIDGFSFSEKTGRINAIYEKRICTYKPPYTVDNYDPNRFFHGTNNRSGDYPSWSVLFDLTKKLNVPLFLLTFDTGNNRKTGAAKIIDISRQHGLSYKNDIKPPANIFDDNLAGLKKWIGNCLSI